MPRLQRLMPVGLPQHVIQRGNNREACFFEETDYLAYLHWLGKAAQHCDVAVHAYVLMTNHVHLLATPHASEALSRMMQYLGRHYVNYINRRYQRTGTLWEGRFKASLVESEAYLLTVYRYIELNPVRAAMVARPEDYRWSSSHAHRLQAKDALITDHEVFVRLGQSAEARAIAYQALCSERLSDEVVAVIREAINTGQVLGGERFKDQIEATLKRKVRFGKPGRPTKRDGNEQLGLEV